MPPPLRGTIVGQYSCESFRRAIINSSEFDPPIGRLFTVLQLGRSTAAVNYVKLRGCVARLEPITPRELTAVKQLPSNRKAILNNGKDHIAARVPARHRVGSRRSFCEAAQIRTALSPASNLIEDDLPAICTIHRRGQVKRATVDTPELRNLKILVLM